MKVRKRNVYWEVFWAILVFFIVLLSGVAVAAGLAFGKVWDVTRETSASCYKSGKELINDYVTRPSNPD